MRINELTGRTAIRLALAFGSFSVLSVLLIFTLLYFSLTQTLEIDIRDRVSQTREALVAIDSEQGFEDLKKVIISEAASVRDADSIFLLIDQNGHYVAGNIQEAPPQFAGWRLLDRLLFPAVRSVGRPYDRFYAIWSPVSKGKLLVGANDVAITETSKALFSALFWGIALAVVVPAVFGAHMARRAQHKIDSLGSTLTAVAAGQFACRVPVTGAKDDLENVAIRINQTLDQLQNLIENVNQASSDIAHDLKHPIGRLRQKLDSACLAAQNITELKTAISEALREIDTIVETFEALLRISQIEAGAGRKRFTSINLKELLANIADVYSAVIEDQDRQFTSELDESVDTAILGDRELLAQLFANLIENAIRHTSPGTQISLQLSAHEESVTAKLCDTGTGIPETERNKVFQRLYRLEKSRSTPGSGLGLSLVAAITQLHNAQITLRDNKPGLCVEITFPRLTSSEFANFPIRLMETKAT
jgi:signal transduction histidine kinase